MSARLRWAAGAWVVLGATALAQHPYPTNQGYGRRFSPYGTRSLDRRQQYGGGQRSPYQQLPYGTNPYQRFGQPRPAVPGIGGGLPTVPLRTPGQGLERLLPFLGGRLPEIPQGKAQGPDLTRWPSWLEIGGPGRRVHRLAGQKAPPKPSDALFVRLADTVEVAPAGEEAFYPLAFWDSSRVLTPGGRVRLSGQGRAQLVFSDGTQVELLREAELTFVLGTKQRLVLDLVRVTRAECRLGSRDVEIRLPDGSSARGTELRVRIDRASREAPWAATGIEDRLLVSNWGKNDLRLDPPAFTPGLRSYEVKPNRRCQIALVPGAPPSGARSVPGPGTGLPQTLPGGGTDLRASVGAEFEKVGAALRVRASGRNAVVAWGGFRCALPSGGQVTIDPLLGRPFGQGRPTPAARKPAPGKGAGK